MHAVATEMMPTTYVGTPIWKRGMALILGSTTTMSTKMINAIMMSDLCLNNTPFHPCLLVVSCSASVPPPPPPVLFEGTTSEPW